MIAKTVRSSLMVMVLLLAGVAALAAPVDDRVEALKTSLKTGLAQQRSYEWIETTAVSIKGEEKKRTENRCYYGADGKLEKVPVETDAAAGKTPHGIRGKAVENKKEEIGDTAKAASALMHQYVPLDPARVQAAKDAGKISVSAPDPSGQVQVKISDYLKPGDSVTVSVDAAKNTLLGIAVNSYMKDAADTVTMKSTLAALGDGTVYPATVTMDIKSENLTVAIENSGYKKLAP